MTPEQETVLRAVGLVVNESVARLSERMGRMTVNGAQQVRLQAPQQVSETVLEIPAPTINTTVEAPAVSVHNEVAVPAVHVAVDMAPVAEALATMTAALVRLLEALLQRPEPAPPTVTVQVPQQPAPAVDVQPATALMARGPRKFRVVRDRQGEMESIEAVGEDA